MIIAHCSEQDHGMPGAFSAYPRRSWEYRNAEGQMVRGTTVETYRQFAEGTTVAKGSTYLGDGDSSYHATYLAEDGTFKQVTYAGTWGWCGRGDARVDATQEVTALWEAHCRRQERDRKARILRGHIQDRRDLCRVSGLTPAQAERVLKLEKEQRTAARFLLSLNPRKDFWKSLRDRVLAWARETAPKYMAPLSGKQLGCVSGRMNYRSY